MPSKSHQTDIEFSEFFYDIRISITPADHHAQTATTEEDGRHRTIRGVCCSAPAFCFLLRGDSHYARPEAMAWCEDNGIDYVFGLAGSKPLSAKVEAKADAVRTERAVTGNAIVRGYAETRHKAKSWKRERRAVAWIEATTLGLDIRSVVTNLAFRALSNPDRDDEGAVGGGSDSGRSSKANVQFDVPAAIAPAGKRMEPQARADAARMASVVGEKPDTSRNRRQALDETALPPQINSESSFDVRAVRKLGGKAT